MIRRRRMGFGPRPEIGESRYGCRGARLKVPDASVRARQACGAQSLAAIIDGQGAIEVRVDVDPRAGVAAAGAAGADLQRSVAELNRIVGGGRAAILEAADAREVGRGGPPGWFGVRRGVGKASVVARPKALKDALRVGERRGMGEPQFDDEAILQRAEEPFHPPFALGRGGRDPADAEFVEGPADLCRGDVPLELLGQALPGARITMKDPVSIGIRGGRQAVAANEVTEEEEVAVGIFHGAKDPGEELAGGIVDRGEQDEARAALLEPGMVAAVHLDEEASLWHAVPAASMTRRPAGARAADAGVAEEALYGGPRHEQALVLAEQVSEVVVVDAGVARAGQQQDPAADGVGQSAGRRVPAVAVRERRRPVSSDSCHQAFDMAGRQAQQSGCLTHGNAALDNPHQDGCSLLLLPAQCDSPLGHGARVTESLSY
jgi:hypothetical protein